MRKNLVTLASLGILGIPFSTLSAPLTQYDSEIVAGELQHTLQVANQLDIEGGSLSSLSRIVVSANVAVAWSGSRLVTLKHEENKVVLLAEQSVDRELFNDNENFNFLIHSGKVLLSVVNSGSNPKLVRYAFVDGQWAAQESTSLSINGYNTQFSLTPSNQHLVWINRDSAGVYKLAENGSASLVGQIKTVSSNRIGFNSAFFDEDKNRLYLSNHNYSNAESVLMEQWTLDTSTQQFNKQKSLTVSENNYNRIKTVFPHFVNGKLYATRDDDLLEIDAESSEQTLSILSAVGLPGWNEPTQIGDRLYQNSGSSVFEIRYLNGSISSRAINSTTGISSSQMTESHSWSFTQNGITAGKLSHTSGSIVDLDSIFDGEQNMPAFNDAKSIYLDDQGLLVTVSQRALDITSVSSQPIANRNYPLKSLGLRENSIYGDLLPIANGFLVSGRDITAANRGNEVVYIDLSEPESPKVKGLNLEVNGNQLSFDYNNLRLVGNRLYVPANSKRNLAVFSLNNSGEATLEAHVGLELVFRDSYYINLFAADDAALMSYEGQLYSTELSNGSIKFTKMAVQDVILSTAARWSYEFGKYQVRDDSYLHTFVAKDNKLQHQSTQFVGWNSYREKRLSPGYMLSVSGSAILANAINPYNGVISNRADEIITQKSGVSFDSFLTSNSTSKDKVAIKITDSYYNGLPATISIVSFNSSPYQSKELEPLWFHEGADNQFSLSDYVQDDNAGDVLTFASDSLPANVELSDAGVLSTKEIGTASQDVSFTVTDSANMSLALNTTLHFNHAPTLSSEVELWANPNASFAFDFNDYVTDPEGHTYSFETSATSALPVKANGLVTGSFTESGETQLSAVVIDEFGAKSTLSVSVIVNTPPTAGQLPAINVKVAEAISADLSTVFSDPNNHELTFSAQGLPEGLQIGSDGVLSGTIRAAGTYSGTIVATDEMGLANLATLTVTVTQPVEPAAEKESSGGGVGLGLLGLMLLGAGRRKKKA
ncbi:putative Ig domain-containing protein [Pseudoalteromonas xiamenensis]|uniref:putative Ig domain-containing protein n=1 Tax=Pseudoalteromonas xiamenensis TaxID=882626 RepID=UPI0035EAB7C2